MSLPHTRLSQLQILCFRVPHQSLHPHLLRRECRSLCLIQITRLATSVHWTRLGYHPSSTARRPSALNNHDVSPSASSASLPPRARTADIPAPSRGGLSSPINKPSFAKSKHSPNASHAHTAQHAKSKTAANGAMFGAPPSSAAHAKLAGNKQAHATHGKSQAATSNK